jgi:hypothetical protein
MSEGADYGAKDGRVEFKCDRDKSLVRLELPTINLGSSPGVEIRLRNDSDSPIRLFAQLNDAFWVSGFEVVQPHANGNVRVYAQRRQFTPISLSDRYPHMNGLPGGQMTLWPDADVDSDNIKELTLYTLDKLPHPVVLHLEGIVIIPSDRLPDEGGSPIIDRFGQLAYKSWPGKVHASSDLKASVLRETRQVRKMEHGKADLYGGWEAGPRLGATGHFRVEKRDQAWWLVDPLGRLFWSDGVTSVTFENPTEVTTRPDLFQDPPADGDFLKRNLFWKFGAAWRPSVQSETLARMSDWGLNTIGPWSDGDLITAGKMPYTIVVSSKDDHGRIDPSSLKWHAHLKRLLSQEQRIVNGDPWCVGVFVDNEIHESTDPKWWETYYSNVHDLMREVMPNTLYLGSRLDFSPYPNVDENRKQIVLLAEKYADVVSFNLYRFTLEDFTLPDAFDKPVIIGEFHFGALDRGMLHTGLRGVRSQRQRADAYVHYMSAAIANRSIVGAHWFEFYDEPTSGRADGENYQTGLVNGTDDPYPETVDAVRNVSMKLYEKRWAAVQGPSNAP